MIADTVANLARSTRKSGKKCVVSVQNTNKNRGIMRIVIFLVWE